MMTVSHMQSVIRRNSTTIQELEKSIFLYHNEFLSRTVVRTLTSPIRKKIATLAALQVTLKKEIKDMLLFNRLYGHESA
jgi:hypothetical protein